MRRAYLELHIAVILFGFTAILGKLISIQAVSLVWWRVLIASIGMMIILRAKFNNVPKERIRQYLMIGGIVALHWITFFASIKVSNASIALASFATTTFFTSLIEPLIVKERHIGADILIGLLVVPAMIMIVQGIDPELRLGIWLGLVSALLVAIFASLNKKLIKHASPMQISFFELSGAWLFISLCLGVLSLAGVGDKAFAGMDFRLHMPQPGDWLYLLVLGLLCTTLAYFLAMRALHHVSAYNMNLVINLEPVYGIVMAWLFLHENRELTTSFYIGAAIILVVVFSYPFVLKNRKYSSVKDAS